MFGSYWASNRFVCSGCKFQSNWHFTGPFTSPESRKYAIGEPSPGYRATPNLYLRTRIDPRTPLCSAQNMRNFYPGTGLAILEAESTPSQEQGLRISALTKWFKITWKQHLLLQKRKLVKLSVVPGISIVPWAISSSRSGTADACGSPEPQDSQFINRRSIRLTSEYTPDVLVTHLHLIEY